MTKQKEIREGMVELCEKNGLGWNEAAYLVDYLLTFQDSKDVVIKVDRELSEEPLVKDLIYVMVRGYVTRAGYTAVEPLIKWA